MISPMTSGSVHTPGSAVSNKQYHVSKVYFYSVSDVLQQEGQGSNPGTISENLNNSIISENESEQHVSILDCETGRVRRGYAQPSNHFSEHLQVKETINSKFQQ